MFLQRSRTPASAFLFWPLLLWNITLRVGGLHGLTNPEVDSLTEVFQQSEYTDVERGVKIKSSFGRLINSLLGNTSFKKECFLSGIAQIPSPPPPLFRATCTSFSAVKAKYIYCIF